MVKAETVNRIIGFHGDGLPVLSLYGRIPPGASTREVHSRMTSLLDQATAGAVLEAVLEHARGRSVLWVTHRPAELALFPDVRHLRGGMT